MPGFSGDQPEDGERAPSVLFAAYFVGNAK